MSNPGQEETLEFLAETVRQRILDRIEEVQGLKDWESGGWSKGTFKGNKTLFGREYKKVGDLERELKRLKRGLGAILTTNLEAKIKPGKTDTWKDLLKEIVHENTQGKPLADKLNNFQKFVEQSATNKFKPGKVGHHRTGLSILRGVLEDKPFDFRAKFKDIAFKNGYKIGEEWIDWIDPAAHKEFTEHVRGKLNERLDYKIQSTARKQKDIPKNLMNALAERYAHAKQFGSNAGWDIPTGVLKDGVDEDTLFKFAQPYLEASKRGANTGLQIDEILTKGEWNTPDELIQELETKIPLNQTDDLLDPFSNQLGTPAAKRNQYLDPNRIQEMGLKESDFQPHLFKDAATTQVAKLTKGLGKVSTGASLAEGMVMLSSGQVIPGTMVLAMQTPAAQKAIAKALEKNAQKLMLKQGLKLIPGVSIGSGLIQGVGYAAQGKWGKAALSGAGGVIGELGPAGDAVQAMIDLSLTVDDARLEIKGKKQPKGEVDDYQYKAMTDADLPDAPRSLLPDRKMYDSIIGTLDGARKGLF